MSTDVAILEKEALTLRDTARTLVIIDHDSYQLAAVICKSAKRILDNVGVVFDPIERRQIADRKNTIEERRGFEAMPKEVLALTKDKMAAWDTEQERLRREQEAALRASLQRQEEDLALAAAEQAEQDGDSATADAILTAPIMAPPVVIPAAPKLDGVSFREVYDFEVVDESKVPRQYWMLDLVKIGKVTRAMKGATNIEGIRVFSRKVTAMG